MMRRRTIVVAAGCLVCGVLACRRDPPSPALDVVLAAGEARAGKVTRSRELIGGPVAYGRAGDVWKLYNRRARFLIQDVGAAVGLDLYGGNLIDADLVRPGDDGTNGRDLFRESFPIVGLHGVKPRAITVVADGTQGGPAILRVSGTDAATDILPQLDVLAQDLGGEITVDYELAPEVPYLKITTTYRAPPGQSLGTLGLGDFLSFGASLAILSPENGFTGGNVKVSFLASSGDGVSYGYVYPAGDLQIPFVDASGTATLLVSDPVAEGGTATVTRYLVVGGGDAASVSGPMYRLRGRATAPLSGRVRDGEVAVAGARVTLFRAPYDAQAPCADQARSGDDGGYRFDVPPGAYVAIASEVGRLRGAPVAIDLPADGRAIDVPIGRPGRIAIAITERVAGAPTKVPAKVSLFASNVERPDPRFGPDPTESERHGLHAVALLADGSGSVRVKPGTYRAVVSRGPEYELATVEGLVVPPGGEARLTAELRRVVDTTGWLAGDYHQHSQGSIDSPVPVRERVIEDLAEGVEYPAATDHDNLTDFGPHIAALAAGGFINALIGNEISVNGIGHFNAYPLAIDPQAPYRDVGAKLWARKTIRELTTQIHGPGTVLHVSHPRTKSLAGWFNAVKFDPTTGEAAGDFPIDGFDAIEVNGDLGRPDDFLAAGDEALHKRATATVPTGVPALRDWFALLALGKTTTALGNSDTHGRNDDAGWPRSYVLVGSDRPDAVAAATLVEALKAQRVIISNGPFVTLTVDGAQRIGKAQPARLGDGGSAALGVRIQAASWIDAATIEVYENGRPLPLARSAPGKLEGKPGGALQLALDARERISEVLRFDGVVTVRPTRDSFYVVIVRGAKSLEPVAGGTPYACTYPVYLDLGGDGWTAPGLH